MKFTSIWPTGGSAGSVWMGAVPDHSTFSKNRHGRFRESDLFRRVFESVLRRCIEEQLVGGEGFAVDASVRVASSLILDAEFWKCGVARWACTASISL